MILAGISLLFVLLVPVWRIDLNAPQYPEGLSLKIYANDIKGDVDIINGLNHYIGMKTLHKADFPEFVVLPYCIMFFSGLFILSAIINRRPMLWLSFSAFVVFGIVAMADFWKWEYNYGHNLNPNAAIVVPGMAYQPPLIGFKQLLNFGAYSIPDIGGWIFIGCGILLLSAAFIEFRLKKITLSNKAKAISAIICVLMISSCSRGPEALRTGRDNCAFCKMTISDPRFGAELQTSTGKLYKFDDIQCLISYKKELETVDREEAMEYVADYCGVHSLIPASQCYLLKGSDLRCPMQGQLIAFSSPDSLRKVMETYKGTQTNWADSK